ncbi:hypothetical protein G3O06_06975 [Burkholderia sp. Ac-20345]|uniref:hypothetical protein n=1 Tax=Burkholderia sp. Ac-20345 TaxID=2703891 RepID=UPI00197B5142|nr:hypothetical protein [Burkholderia sp. Ac-20345]MBN3777301.1 hypothetical protein [Burkholderia sp. Ac-20345]
MVRYMSRIVWQRLKVLARAGSHSVLTILLHRPVDGHVDVPAPGGMIDACHIVDSVTLASSPIHGTRDSRFVHFPAQHDRHRTMTMRACGHPSHQRSRSGT